jgi:serine/threonine protein phosphatase 1
MTGEKWNSVLRLEKNKSGRDFVCGDIHGCFDDLEAKLKKMRFNKTFDRLFSVGDLIDRGPRSELATYYMTRHWFFPVMGNHENMFLMGHLDFPGREKYIEAHIKNGGAWAYKKLDAEKGNALLEAIDNLPLIIQVDDTIIVHAALPAVESLEEIEKNPPLYFETALWHREVYPPVLIPGTNRVFVGHTIVEKPTQYDKVINIDTGINRIYRGKSGELTIMEIGGQI